MLSSGVVSAVETALNFQWEKLMKIQQGASFTTTSGGSVTITGPTWIGFVGASFALLLSVLGAFDNAAQTIYWVEDGIDDWLKGYGKGKYEDVLKDEEESEAMENMLNEFSIEMIIYSMCSMAHSFFLVVSGFVGAFIIFQRVVAWEAVENNGSFRYEIAWRHLFFGVLVGSVDWLAGNISKNLVKYILYAIGLTDHSYTNLDNLTFETTELSSEGITMSSRTLTYPSSSVAYDFKKMLKMADYWFGFWYVFRSTAFFIPFILFAILDGGVILTFALLFSFIYYN